MNESCLQKLSYKSQGSWSERLPVSIASVLQYQFAYRLVRSRIEFFPTGQALPGYFEISLSNYQNGWQDAFYVKFLV